MVTLSLSRIPYFADDICTNICFRLKFLLNQSDIFSHFGVKVASKKPQEAPGRSEEGRGRRKKGSNGGGGGLAEDELDDDELAMLEEEEDSEDEAAGAPTPSKGHTGALVRQPSCIVGGQMRYSTCVVSSVK